MADKEKKQLEPWGKTQEDKVLFNYVDDPLERVAGLKLIGKLPHRKSKDIQYSALGIGFETLDRDSFDPVPTFPWLGESGVKFARCQTGWMKCEKKPGVYDFKWLDVVVDGLAKVGIETWFSLGYGHPVHTPCKIYEDAWKAAKGGRVQNWARGWVAETPYYHGKKAMEAWKRYVVALAKHFKGRVKIWEVWNEPEGWWIHEGKEVKRNLVERAADYTEFVRFTAKAVKSVIPDAEIGANVAQTATVYIPALGKAGLADLIDIFSYHFYGNTPEEYMHERYEHIRTNLLRKDGRPLKIFQGESGRSSGKSTLFSLPTELSQARYLARRYLIDILCGAKLSSFFTATDLLDYYPDGRDSFFGVINTRTNTPKLAYHVLQNMGWLCDGLENAPDYFCGLRPDSRHYFGSMAPYQLICGSFRRKGLPVFAVWIPEHVDLSAQPVHGILHMVSDVKHQMKDPVIMDPIRGKVWSAKALMGIEDDGGGFIGATMLKGFTAVDWPLFVADSSIFKEKK